jgi:hypothetical protein
MKQLRYVYMFHDTFWGMLMFTHNREANYKPLDNPLNYPASNQMKNYKKFVSDGIVYLPTPLWWTILIYGRKQYHSMTYNRNNSNFWQKIMFRDGCIFPAYHIHMKKDEDNTDMKSWCKENCKGLVAAFEVAAFEYDADRWSIFLSRKSDVAKLVIVFS